MRLLKNKKGFSFIELVVVMAIMSIVGTAVAGLLRTGLSASGRISENMATETEARTALSLITVQLRQHDATGAIHVKSDKEVWLYDDSDAMTGTAVLFKDGGLYSYKLTNGLVDETDEPIANISGFKITHDISESGLLNTYKITITYGKDAKSLSQTITQRSAPLPQPTDTP